MSQELIDQVIETHSPPLIRYSHPKSTTIPTDVEIPDIVTILDSYIVNGTAPVIASKEKGSTVHATNVPAYCIAASALILPEVPTLVAYSGNTSTVLKIISLTCKRSNCGLYVHIKEASPATKGVAIEVPFK